MRDLTGETFSRLTVISFAGLISKKSGRKRYWNCVCECGKEVLLGTNQLASGHTRSCGCLHSEVTGALLRTHGLSGTSEHEKWKAAKGRCYNKNNRRYAQYGGRGIVMSDEWRENFPQFLADMGKCPPGLTLDRRDNDGPYSKENCRWATQTEQSNNRTKSVRVSAEETLPEMARRLGVNRQSLWHQYINKGLSLEDAIKEAQRLMAIREARASRCAGRKP